MNKSQKFGYGIIYFIWASFIVSAFIIYFVENAADSRQSSRAFGNYIYDHMIVLLAMLTIISWIGSLLIFEGPIGRKEKATILLAFLNPFILYVLYVITALIGCSFGSWWC